MIQSQFTRKLKPYILASAVTAGLLTNSIIQNKCTEQEATTQNPIENIDNKKKPLSERSGLWGTLLGLSVLGAAGCLVLGKSVDMYHKKAHETIDDIFDATNITEEELMSAFEESCKEKEEKGIKYDKEELKKNYIPRSKAIKNMINSMVTQVTAVTRNVEKKNKKNKEKEITQQFLYSVEELKSAIKYGYEIEDDSARIRMHYFYDKATTPQKKWPEVEAKYKKDYPDIDFSDYGVKDEPIKLFHQENFENSFFDLAWLYQCSDTELNSLGTKKIALDELYHTKEFLENSRDGQYFNKYDRKAGIELVNRAINEIENGKDINRSLIECIANIYIYRQM